MALERRFRGDVDAIADPGNELAAVSTRLGIAPAAVKRPQQRAYLRLLFGAEEGRRMALDQVPAAMAEAGPGARAALFLFVPDWGDHVVGLYQAGNVTYPLDMSMRTVETPMAKPLRAGSALRKGYAPMVTLVITYRPPK